MLTQKQWKIQHLAEQLLNTATSADAEAASRDAQRQGAAKDHLIVAEEIRNVAAHIMEALEHNIFGGLADNEFDVMINDLAKRTSFLALNAALVACKVREHKAMAVFADRLRSTALEILSLYGKEKDYVDIPAVYPRSRVVTDVFYLLCATSGNVRWYENAHLVQEFLDYCPEYFQGNRLVINNNWRNMNLPIIRLGDVPEDPSLVIVSDAHNPQKLYAVVASVNLHSLANSYVGVSKPCDAGIPIRECWSASDGSDIIFPDWEKLSG